MFLTSADAYDRFIGRYGSALASELVAFVGVAEEMRVLDVGCGTGVLTAALAGRVGSSNVSAIDLSEPFVEACRRRVPGADVVVGSAESLPFRDGSFDAVLSQLVVNFMSDAPAGAREMVRVTKRGGVVAACVWDYAGEMTLLRAFWDAAREVDPERGAAADEGTAMRWCGEGELAGLLRESGLTDVRSTSFTVPASYAGFNDLWEPLPTGVGPAGAFCASLDDERRERLRLRLRSRLGVGDEPFVLHARAWAASGVVPA